MAKRNVEEIRRKNLEENQRFLNKLRMNTIRDDFLQSARTAVPKGENKTKHKIHYEKVERLTRYNLKVQSGEIQPLIPQRQQKINKKKTRHPSKWTLFYKNMANPYKRTFKPRIRK
ncbi:unnamed protein product [Rotaria sp. Silwood1]|nr:unnamed protein product [Rotaria sp. Silwood1]CAF0913090.1 unnamed protein product [Rotaria sp. Silwood1]CAF0939764.1 unnamed protein product [Rotaria sp. Silwood1]CAF3373829.1 unnamed protein product [Rotaria sp. Silwood1]CAF3381960.1 unnamed protein product [Rotaria sp. Silwood1]